MLVESTDNGSTNTNGGSIQTSTATKSSKQSASTVLANKKKENEEIGKLPRRQRFLDFYFAEAIEYADTKIGVGNSKSSTVESTGKSRSTKNGGKSSSTCK